MVNTTEMVFDSPQKIEVKVRIGDNDYMLFEADGAATTERENAILAGTILKDGKPVRMSGFASVDAILLSRCLMNKSGQHVKLQIINSWPSRIREKLIDRLKEISQITDTEEDTVDAEEAAGNLLEGTTDGSS